MTVFLIIALFLLVFFLVKATDQVVIAVRRLSKNSGTLAFAISALFLAVATSLPELSVGITSALEGTPNLSLGNVLGANIANLSLVAGLSAILVGRVNVHSRFIRHEVFVAALAAILPLVLIYDKTLSRVDGLILLAAYGAYASSFFKRRFAQISEEHRKEGFFIRILQRVSNIDGNTRKESGRLFVGIALLLITSNLIVRVSSIFAQDAGIPVFLVGLILLSIGTTLPELIFSIRSLGKDQPTMFFGNLLGSVIANSLLVTGVVATLSPIQISAVSEYMIAITAFLVIFATFWFFVRSKLTLERWEAAVLFLIYLTFVFVEFV
ncbi:sodium:calcium antiporter [Candidatus Woesebacteria bacterium]|nr:sodium:calcium antiporter [Candidatus Woesebacteria bacterium]